MPPKDSSEEFNKQAHTVKSLWLVTLNKSNHQLRKYKYLNSEGTLAPVVSRCPPGQLATSRSPEVQSMATGTALVGNIMNNLPDHLPDHTQPPHLPITQPPALKVAPRTPDNFSHDTYWDAM